MPACVQSARKVRGEADVDKGGSGECDTRLRWMSTPDEEEQAKHKPKEREDLPNMERGLA